MPRHAKHIRETPSANDAQQQAAPAAPVEAPSAEAATAAAPGSATAVGSATAAAPAPEPAPAPASAPASAPAPMPASVAPTTSPTPVAQTVPTKPRTGLRAAVAIILILIVLAGAAGAILVLRPPFAEGVLQALGIVSAPAENASSSAEDVQEAVFSAIDDTEPTALEQATMDAEAKEKARTPIIAQCNGVDLHSPIAMADLTGLLFHQASNEYALILTTDLPEADYERVADDGTMRINHDQEGSAGAWADTEALHLWRDTADTEIDTCIDVGGLAGTTVVSPVDGTVVLIRDYVLEGEVDDIEIHIQPTGRPDLDCVLIHTYDPLVKAGDRVEAGITPISHVRDIEKDLDDVQLGFFTPEGVGGNHTHVQVNDTNYKDYRERRLSGAVAAP